MIAYLFSTNFHYYDDDIDLPDIDECDTGADDCVDANALCANTPPGSWTCSCATGYTGTGTAGDPCIGNIVV